MIEYNKNLDMTIQYRDLKEKDNQKSKSLKLNAGSFWAKGFKVAMSIKIDEKTIVVDAEWLKEACEKAIQINRI